MPRRATRTSFRPGQSGNPRGRRPGTLTRKTIEVRDICNALVDDPEYRESLRRRMIEGNAGSMEVLVWHYAKGKPVDRIEAGTPGAFSNIPDSELKELLRRALIGLA